MESDLPTALSGFVPGFRQMSEAEPVADPLRRRRLLTRLFQLLLWLGLGLATVPFVASLLGGPQAPVSNVTRVNLTTLAPGEARRVMWNNRVVWVLRRSQAQIRALGTQTRSVDPQVFVAYADPGYSGCPLQYRGAHEGPTRRRGWLGGFVEPCEGAWFDAAGHVLPGSPAAARPLPIPPSRRLAGDILEIGLAGGATAGNTW